MPLSPVPAGCHTGRRPIPPSLVLDPSRRTSSTPALRMTRKAIFFWEASQPEVKVWALGKRQFSLYHPTHGTSDDFLNPLNTTST